MQNLGPKYLFSENMIILHIFESRRTNFCGLVTEFEIAWPLTWNHDVANASNITISSFWFESLASNNQFLLV